MSKDKSGYCTISLRVDKNLEAIIEKLRGDTGLSVREILGYSDKPCSCCKNVEVVAFNSLDKSAKIPRGLLFNALLTKHGEYVKGRNTGKTNK